jgi:hypothetical protein
MQALAVSMRKYGFERYRLFTTVEGRAPERAFDLLFSRRFEPFSNAVEKRNYGLILGYGRKQGLKHFFCLSSCVRQTIVPICLVPRSLNPLLRAKRLTLGPRVLEQRNEIPDLAICFSAHNLTTIRRVECGGRPLSKRLSQNLY